MRVIEIQPKDGLKASHRKEGKLDKEYTVITLQNGEFKSKIILRIYYPGQTAYACLWVWDDKVNCKGSGSAGGGGYHKQSAAASEAFIKAGIKLDQSINGRGDSAIIDALSALARKLGMKKFMVHEAHG